MNEERKKEHETHANKNSFVHANIDKILLFFVSRMLSHSYFHLSCVFVPLIPPPKKRKKKEKKERKEGRKEGRKNKNIPSRKNKIHSDRSTADHGRPRQSPVDIAWQPSPQNAAKRSGV